MLKEIELYWPTDCWKYFNRWCHIQCLFDVVKLQFHQVKVLTTDGECSMLTPGFLLNMLHCWVQKLQEMMYVSKHMYTKVFVCIKVEVENQAWISSSYYNYNYWFRSKTLHTTSYWDRYKQIPSIAYLHREPSHQFRIWLKDQIGF